MTTTTPPRWAGCPPRPALVLAGDRMPGIERGMVFWAEVLPQEARGSEQMHSVPWPWMIISSDDVHLKLGVAQAVPFSSKLDKQTKFRGARIRVPLAEIVDYDFTDSGRAPDRHLDAHDQLALTEQTRVLSHRRLVGPPIAKLTPKAMYSVEAGVRYVLGL